jgi:DNA repair exonuclease SbcCD ATPase subunit
VHKCVCGDLWNDDVAGCRAVPTAPVTAEGLRERLTEALLDPLKCCIVVDSWGVHGTCKSCWPKAQAAADAVLAVRDEELERLRAELTEAVEHNDETCSAFRELQACDERRRAAEAERDLLRETLADSDLGAQVLAQWEAIAAADADRDRLEAERDALKAKLEARREDEERTYDELEAEFLRAAEERDALKAAIAEQTQRTLNAAADKLYALPATDGAALKGPYWYRQGFTQAADLLRDWADYPGRSGRP